MCGIAGLFGCQNIPKYDRIAEVLSQKIADRGPDAHGHYSARLR